MLLFQFNSILFHSIFLYQSFEGIEGTVDIATICGTTGPTILEDLTSPCRDRRLQEPQTVGDIKLGLIVQTISINSNMPLPIAP